MPRLTSVHVDYVDVDIFHVWTFGRAQWTDDLPAHQVILSETPPPAPALFAVSLPQALPSLLRLPHAEICSWPLAGRSCIFYLFLAVILPSSE